jgi:stearoyl-CoA desaturase (delta-9 desaturase)
MATARTKGLKLDWPAVAVVGLIHVMALAAFVPWLFSWTGVVLAIGGCYVFGTLGINLCFHRLLSHRSYKCPLWFEHAIAVLGVCCLEKTPGQFVATHRAHHQHSDHDGDPHSPLASLFWGHMGWALVQHPEFYNTATYDKYAKDVFRDRFYLQLERNILWVWIYAAHAVLFFLAGFAVGSFLPGGTWLAGVQFGLSLLVWGVYVRTVLVWHITWSVNSIGHVWGYQNYKTRINEPRRTDTSGGSWMSRTSRFWHSGYVAWHGISCRSVRMFLSPMRILRRRWQENLPAVGPRPNPASSPEWALVLRGQREVI